MFFKIQTENILVTDKNDISTIKIADFGLSVKYKTVGSYGLR